MICTGKIIKYITDNYGIVMIGKLNMQSVTSTDNNLNAKTKKIGLAMCHYEFRQRLVYKCKAKGILIKEVDERYTTKVCSKCATCKHNLKGEKIYRCQNANCKLVIDRDVNGCLNIIIKCI